MFPQNTQEKQKKKNGEKLTIWLKCGQKHMKQINKNKNSLFQALIDKAATKKYMHLLIPRLLKRKFMF